MMNENRARLYALFDVRRGEGQIVLLLTALGFVEGLANVLARTTTFSLFVSEFGSEMLPYAYIGTALFAALFSYVYLRATRRLALGKVLLGVELGTIALLLLLRIGLEFAQGRGLAFSMPVAFGVLNTVQITAYWALVGRILTLRQNKRLTGLLDVGAIVAFMLGGFLTPILVYWMGSANILFVAAFCVGLAYFVLLRIVNSYSTQLDFKPEKEKAHTTRTHPLKNRYVLLIVANFTLYVVANYFVDNIFFSMAELRFPDEDALTSFLGIFWGIASVLILLTQAFVAGRFLTRYGVGIVMLVTPLVLTFESGVMAVAGTVFGVTLFLFWMAVLTNLTRFVLDGSDQAATNVLFQPLPDQQRTEVQSMVSGIVYPVGIGLAGVGLLIATNIFHMDVIRLTYLLTAITLLWAVVALFLRRQYPLELIRALTRRDFGDADYLASDPASLEILGDGIKSDNPGVVDYSLNLLEDVRPAQIVEHLPRLLAHPNEIIRLDALHRTERLGLESALPIIQDRFETESSPRVRGAALRVIAALSEVDGYDSVIAYLDAPERQLRSGALVGLLRNGSLDGVLAAAGILSKQLESEDAEDRRFVAQVLGESERLGFFRPVVQLLDDTDVAVQRTALQAAAKLQHPRLWPEVIRCLENRGTRATAATALVAGGDAIIPSMEPGLQAYAQDRAVTMKMIQILGRLGGAQAIRLLEPLLERPDEQIRTHTLAALVKCGYRLDSAETDQVDQQIEAEVAQAAWLAAALVDLAEGEELKLVRSALQQHLQRIRQRVLLWLACIYDARALKEVSIALGLFRSQKKADADSQHHAYAMETLDVLLTTDQRRLVVPLLDGVGSAEIDRNLSGSFPPEVQSVEQRLDAIICGAPAWFTPWAKAVALDAVARLPLPALAPAVRSYLDSTDALMRETAANTWAVLEDTEPADSGTDTRTQSGSVTLKEETSMLSTVEKVIALRGLRLFTDTPDEVLVDVAGFLGERAVARGDVIFEEGDFGDTLYIIAQGSVRVHQGGQTLAELGEFDAFGEFAILDPAPRSATVTALEDTRLLLLDQATFEELIADHSEIARHIMQDLVHRVREMEAELRPI